MTKPSDGNKTAQGSEDLVRSILKETAKGVETSAVRNILIKRLGVSGAGPRPAG